jgi:cell division protein FtsL
MTPPPAAAAPAVRPRRSASPKGPPRPSRGAPTPRRVSGPAKRAAAARPVARAAVRGGAVALPAPRWVPGWPSLGGLLDVLAGVSMQRLLDRLIRGRSWIALVAFALIGIVAMQLWVVKLGVGIGRALEHEGLLRRENSALSIEDSTLASGERVERLAAARGMVVAPPGALHFDSVKGPLDTRLAAAALAKPTQAQLADFSETGFAATETSATSTEAPVTATSTEASTSTSSEAATGEVAPAASTESAAGSEAGTSVSETPATGVPTPESSTTPEGTSTAGETGASAPTSGEAGAEATAGPSGGVQAGVGG